MLIRRSYKWLSTREIVTKPDSLLLWSIYPSVPFKTFGLGGSKVWSHVAFLFYLWHKEWNGTPIPCKSIRVIVIYIMPDSALIDSLNHTDFHLKQSSTSCWILWEDALLKETSPQKEETGFFPSSTDHLSQQLFGFVLCLDIFLISI